MIGGRATAGVVRAGNTVLRPRGNNAEFAQGLLRDLERAGCNIAPHHLGIDSKGRDILTFIEGETYPSLRDYEDEAVIAAARLLRRLHNATRGSALAVSEEVVCHFDCGPYNAIFRDGLPFAWIDFDMAAPGKAIDDVAYLAWMWCIASQAKRAPLTQQCAQLALLADAYGLDPGQRSRLSGAIVGRIDVNILYWEAVIAGVRSVTISGEKARSVLIWSHEERAHMLRYRALFDGAVAHAAR